MADFSSVPVVEVDKFNMDKHMEGMTRAVEQASFVAVDCELSGLGDRKKLNAPTIDERYKNTSLVAKTRSVISLGLSTFRLLPGSEEGKEWSYSVTTYNITLLCQEDYIVEPGSLKFLVEHGFDFQSQYSRGAPYLRGNDRDEEDLKGIRKIFATLVASKKPMVLHNGLIDLVFLYHNFWCALPDKLGTFTSDLAEMFPGGIYDTKYIADFVSRTQASYLEFVFRKEQRANQEKAVAGRPHVQVAWAEVSDTIWRTTEAGMEEEDREVCFNYAHHGHCPEGNSCSKSHSIDGILKAKNLEQEKKRKKRKVDAVEGEATAKVSKVEEEEASEIAEEAVVKASTGVLSAGGHRAGFDAFMTGFSLATFLVHQTKLPRNPSDFMPENINSGSLVNRVYLVSKDFPMLIQSSAFSKRSLQHDIKMKKLSIPS